MIETRKRTCEKHFLLPSTETVFFMRRITKSNPHLDSCNFFLLPGISDFSFSYFQILMESAWSAMRTFNFPSARAIFEWFFLSLLLVTHALRQNRTIYGAKDLDELEWLGKKVWVNCLLHDNYRVHRNTDVISFIWLSLRYSCPCWIRLNRSFRVHSFFCPFHATGLIWRSENTKVILLLSFLSAFCPWIWILWMFGRLQTSWIHYVIWCAHILLLL